MAALDGIDVHRHEKIDNYRQDWCPPGGAARVHCDSNAERGANVGSGYRKKETTTPNRTKQTLQELADNNFGAEM